MEMENAHIDFDWRDSLRLLSEYIEAIIVLQDRKQPRKYGKKMVYPQDILQQTRIIRELKNRGLTVSEMVQEIGRSPDLIKKIIKGIVHEIDIEEQIAHYLKKSHQELFSRYYQGPVNSDIGICSTQITQIGQYIEKLETGGNRVDGDAAIPAGRSARDQPKAASPDTGKNYSAFLPKAVPTWHEHLLSITGSIESLEKKLNRSRMLNENPKWLSAPKEDEQKERIMKEMEKQKVTIGDLARALETTPECVENVIDGTSQSKAFEFRIALHLDKYMNELFARHPAKTPYNEDADSHYTKKIEELSIYIAELEGCLKKANDAIESSRQQKALLDNNYILIEKPEAVLQG